MKHGRFALVVSVAVTAAISTAVLLGMSPSAAPAVGVRTVAPAYPNSIAAIGHSDTNGSGVRGPRTNWPHSSWVTGDSPAVQSLYSRILARNPAIRGNKFNLAISGADAASMLLQAKKAVGLKPAPELVVVQGIDNDIACDTVSHKPFQVAFARVLETLAAGLPDSRIFVVSQFGSPTTSGQGVDDQAAPQASGGIRGRERAVRLHRPKRSDPPEAARVPRGRHPPLRDGRRYRLQARRYVPLRRWRLRTRRRPARVDLDRPPPLLPRRERKSSRSRVVGTEASGDHSGLRLRIQPHLFAGDGASVRECHLCASRLRDTPDRWPRRVCSGLLIHATQRGQARRGQRQGRDARARECAGIERARLTWVGFRALRRQSRLPARRALTRDPGVPRSCAISGPLRSSGLPTQPGGVRSRGGVFPEGR